jgi:hypothetical protein
MGPFLFFYCVWPGGGLELARQAFYHLGHTSSGYDTFAGAGLILVRLGKPYYSSYFSEN